jgi:hypothetical protein
VSQPAMALSAPSGFTSQLARFIAVADRDMPGKFSKIGRSTCQRSKSIFNIEIDGDPQGQGIN